ncbi:MAG: cytochrome b N-terminal domain-containing protein [Elusimicrobia bacterium]|nr:cytochrome b N-terminal domain-containing protein [Elusimicrobiota bacterium]
MKLSFETVKKEILEHPIWRSMFRGGKWHDTARDRAQHIIGNVWLHLHPAKLRKRAVRFTYTWGLGGLSFGLFFVLTLSGVLLMFYYRPTVHLAYQDIKDLEYVVTMGSFWRNFHRWAAHLMVIITIFHMIRVFLTGSYKSPREFNWVVGTILLVLTLLLSFSGYLLPWDQIAIWAITVGSNMASNTPILGAEGPFSIVNIKNDARFMLLGGTYVGESALLRFYVLHCVAFPFITGIFLIVHFWRIRKDGFSAAPLDLKNKNEEKVDVWPNLVVREYLYAMAALALLTAWAIFMQAPLEEEANVNVTPNPAKAPWYFLGLQELLVYFDPWIAGVVLPTLIVIGLMAIPYLDNNLNGVGFYSLKERPFANTFFLFGIALWFILIVIGTYLRGPNWAWYWPWEDWMHHKPPPPPTWSPSNLVGSVLLGIYFLGGIILPRWIRKEIPFKKYCWIGIGAIALFSIVLKLVLANRFEVWTGQTLGWEQIFWVVFAAALYYIMGILVPQRYIRDLSWPRYVISMLFLLMMVGVLLKVGLRLGFNIKYIFSIPQFGFNI